MYVRSKTCPAGSCDVILCGFWFLHEPPVQGYGTDGPPALVQAAAGLLQGVTLHLSATGSIFIPKQDVAQTEHGRYSFRMLLDVLLQLLDRHMWGDTETGVTSVDTGATMCSTTAHSHAERRSPHQTNPPKVNVRLHAYLSTCCSASLLWISWW